MTEPAVLTSKAHQVKEVFESPQWYLSRGQYNIRLRAAAIRDLLAGRKFERILDIGCGDGSLSVQLLTPQNRLTLVDLSGGMLAAAQANIPRTFSGNVEVVNEDVMSAPLEPHGYDLILCLGVLAHVDSPAALVERIAALLRHNGTVVMESSDAHHPIGRAVVMNLRLREMLKARKYRLNLLSRREVIDMFGRHSLKLGCLYRYTRIELPGVERLLPQDVLYGLVRLVYGTVRHNRNAWLGKECIYLFHANGMMPEQGG